MKTASNAFGTFGSKYESNMGTVEIARAIRADLKACGALPSSTPMHLPKGLKVSVRTSFYSGGSSIDLNVTASPVELLNPASLMFSAVFPHERNEFPQHSKEGARILAVLERVAGQYNFDKSDIMSDYFHVNFYSHVGVQWEVERNMRAALLVRLADLRGDIAVMATSDEAAARRRIESVNEGYAGHHYERAAVAELFTG